MLKILLLVFGPAADGVIMYYFLDWISVSGITLWAGALAFGIISHILLQPLFVPQRLVVWRLATQNIVRRKRQSALLMAGLVVASAIITSSMVVGDSLDATVRQEVEGSWGETDLTVSGFDLSIGERVAISEYIANQMWEEIQNESSLRSVVDAQQQGLVSSASVSGQESSLTGVTWMAMNSSIDSIAHWPVIGSQSDGIRYNDIREANQFSNTTYVVINRILADELNLVAGDVFEFGWYVTNESKRQRIDSNATVLSVVSNIGQGASAGTQSPALFTDLHL